MSCLLKYSHYVLTLGILVAALGYHVLTKSDPNDANLAARVQPIVDTKEDKAVASFLSLASGGTNEDSALSYINRTWNDSYEAMAIESSYFAQNPQVRARILRLLEKKTRQNFGNDFDKWFQWLWNKPETYNDTYFEFKAKLHQKLDAKFYTYFIDRSDQATIRLDEVRWGGVLQDGIPPLRNPKMISSSEATY